jgi:hypothetical protein
MHFIKLSSENVCIYTYFNAHRRLISMVSLTSSSSHSFIHIHMSYRVLFFACLRSIHYDNHAILDLSMYIYRCEASSESRQRQVSHAVYRLEGITSKHLEKHIHAPGCDDILIHMITSFTCRILFLLSHSLINRR